MYNRYLRPDTDGFSPVVPDGSAAPDASPSPGSDASGRIGRILERLHVDGLLSRFDTADLLLLLLILFLWKEDADDEVLLALGLLLIL